MLQRRTYPIFIFLYFPFFLVCTYTISMEISSSPQISAEILPHFPYLIPTRSLRDPSFPLSFISAVERFTPLLFSHRHSYLGKPRRFLPTKPLGLCAFLVLYKPCTLARNANLNLPGLTWLNLRVIWSLRVTDLLGRLIPSFYFLFTVLALVATLQVFYSIPSSTTARGLILLCRPS
jgi:hypothetical protein